MNRVAMLLVAVLAAGAEAQSGKAKCSSDWIEASMLQALGPLSSGKVQLPTNQAKLTQYCKAIAASEASAKQYAKCLDQAGKNFLTMLAGNMKRINKPFCDKNGKKKTAFIAWSKCGNAAKPETEKCWNSLRQGMALAKEIKHINTRTPVMCCKYYEWVKCTEAGLHKTKDCNRESQQGYAQSLLTSMQLSFGYACDRFPDDTAKCQKHLMELANKQVVNVKDTPIGYILDALAVQHSTILSI